MDKELLIEQYKIYYSMKERFVDRNFTTNKFYLAFVFIILMAMFYTKDISFDYNITANLVLSILGMGISYFWWANADTYNTMIRVKLKHVMDEIEKELPFQIHALEQKGFVQYKKQNKILVFSDMQKAVALAMLIIFFVLFLLQIVYPIAELIYGPMVTI
jgi:hypothetical protein